MPRTRTSSGAESPAVAPSPLYLVVQALASCIDGPPGHVAALLDISLPAWHRFCRQTQSPYHAYWEWVVGAIRPTVHLTTPLGRFPIKLLRPDDRFIENQCLRRVTSMLGARCSLEGSRVSVRDSQRSAIEQFAEPMPAGVFECSDPIDLVTDIVTTQRVPVSNVPLVTGVPAAYLDNCYRNAAGSAIDSIRMLWHIASRMGCTLTVVHGTRTNILSPSTAPDRAAMVAVVAGHARGISPPTEFRNDLDREIVASIVSGEMTVIEAAARHQVSRQAIMQRLTGHGITCTLLKSHARLLAARAVLRRYVAPTGGG
jgi:hypothetical protein